MNESVLVSPRSQLKRHANICQPCPEIVQRNTDHLILVLHFSHFTALFVPFCARGWSFNIHWCGTWGVAGWTVKVLPRCVSFNTLKLQRNYWGEYVYIYIYVYMSIDCSDIFFHTNGTSLLWIFYRLDLRSPTWDWLKTGSSPWVWVSITPCRRTELVGASQAFR